MWQCVIWTRCALQFPLFPNFLLSVPLRVVIWSNPEQGYNSATEHFVWVVQSPRTVYHWTFVRHLHYQRSKTCSRHIFSHVPTLLTMFPRVRAATLYGALVVSLAILLRRINCRFIIIIIIDLAHLLQQTIKMGLQFRFTRLGWCESVNNRLKIKTVV